MNNLILSVVICSYADERRAQLEEAVISVRQQSLSAHEIIVVVDHNLALFDSLRSSHDDIIVVQNLGPRGLSASRDQGVSAATGDIVAFLDDDAVASTDWLSQLHVHYQDLNVIGVGGAISPLWETGRPAIFPCEFDWVVGCTYHGMPVRQSTVRNLIGCNMSFRTEVFGPIGGFRVGVGRVGAVPVGGEETDFCIRIRQRWPEAKIVYDPSAVVHHRVPGSRASWRYFGARCFAEGRSKAILSQLLGSGDTLESERAYTRQVLPRGAIRGLGDTVLRRDISGLGRALVITMGLAITTLGYATGSVSQRPHWPITRRKGESNG